MDNGEEFADIVGSIHRPEVKDFLTAGDVYSPVLHGTGISAAGGVYGKAVFCDGGRKGSVGAGNSLGRRGSLPFDVRVRRRGKGFFRFLARVGDNQMRMQIVRLEFGEQ